MLQVCNRAIAPASSLKLPLQCFIASLLTCCLGMAAASTCAAGQASEPVRKLITLVRSDADRAEELAFSKSSPMTAFAARQEGYHSFGSFKVGDSSPAYAYTLRFEQPSTVKSISIQGDFRQTGGTCTAGHAYAATEICQIELAFAPRAPGHRNGKIIVEHSASAHPMIIPVGGDSVGPVISFSPAVIVPVPSLYGLLECSDQMAIDGGDNLYLPDCKGGALYYASLNGPLNTDPPQTINSNWSKPSGVATDAAGDVIVAENGDGVVGIDFADGTWQHLLAPGGSGISACTYASPCSTLVQGGASGLTFSANPDYLATDGAGNIYVDGFYGNVDFGIMKPTSEKGDSLIANYWNAGMPFAYKTDHDLFGVDAAGNVYTSYATTPATIGNNCFIYAQNPQYSDGLSGASFWRVAGNRNCGFAGDGGPSTAAEIGNKIEGFAFDAAGDFYFTDQTNGVVRRIDAATGIIHTVAGVGGKLGSGSLLAPSNELQIMPTSIAVDAFGNVYTTTLNDLANLDIVQVASGNGYLNFPDQTGGTTTSNVVLISNTGNAPLTFLDFLFSQQSGENTSAFAIDLTTTNCYYSVPLEPGASCQIGIKYSPKAATGTSSSHSAYDIALLSVITNAAPEPQNQNIDYFNPLQSLPFATSAITLTGTDLSPATMTLSPTSLAFGDQTVKTTSSAKVLNLTNEGQSTLTLQSPFLSGPTLPAGFTVSATTCGNLLLSGESCTFSIKFSPTSVAAYSGKFSLPGFNGVAYQTVTIPVTGTGTAATAKPIITLTSAVKTANALSGLNLVAKIANAPGNTNSPKPTGTVKLMDGDKLLASESLPSSGTVNFILGALPAGSYQLSAQYSGDSHHAPATSNTLVESLSR